MSKKNLSFQGIYKDFFKLKPKDMVIINRLLIYMEHINDDKFGKEDFKDSLDKLRKQADISILDIAKYHVTKHYGNTDPHEIRGIVDNGPYNSVKSAINRTSRNSVYFEDILKILNTDMFELEILSDYYNNENKNGDYLWLYNSISDRNKHIIRAIMDDMIELDTASHSVEDNLIDFSPNYKQIVQQYLINSPKQFGAVLSRIMDIQGLTSQKIVKMWSDKEYASKVDRLKKDRNHQLSDLELSSLLKILLVSEDVLKTGSGKIFGNWNDILKTPKESEDWEILQNAYNTTKAKSIKQEINKDICNIINHYDDVYSMVKDNPSFFYEDDICVYLCENNDESYYDYQAMCEDLLHPEEFDTLLSILEQQQALQENNE